MITQSKILIIVCFVSVGLLFPAFVFSEDSKETRSLPNEVNTELGYLLDRVTPDNSSHRVDIGKIEHIIQFILTFKDENFMFAPEEKKGASAAFNTFSVDKNLSHILKYAFNAEIPAQMVIPASIRLGYWSEVQSNDGFPKLWKKLETLDEPFIVRGIEYQETTPDLFSGTYYSYNSYRTLILCKHNNNNMLISLSKQKDVSTVAKKGIILGQDEDWNYLYTGEKGIGKAGLGWVDAYMYDSFCVTVYYETKPDQVQISMFSWVRAGWSGLNFVQSFHIYRGLQRYATCFKKVIEHPLLPDTAELTKMVGSFTNLAPEKLKERVDIYLKKLTDRYEQASAKKKIDHVYESYKDLSDKEMHAILTLELLKEYISRKGRG